MRLRKYKHILIKDSDKLIGNSCRQKYLVKTINMTFAHQRKNGVIDYTKIHYNEYTTTLEKLEKWILDCGGEVAECIVGIEKL